MRRKLPRPRGKLARSALFPLGGGFASHACQLTSVQRAKVRGARFGLGTSARFASTGQRFRLEIDFTHCVRKHPSAHRLRVSAVMSFSARVENTF